MNVAFLGLGAIGEPMAAHLAKEPFRLTVWNRTTSKAESFTSKHGVRNTESAADAVADAEFIITCLPSSREVDELVSQIEHVVAKGAMLIDCTSGDPATSRRISDRLAGNGVSFIDAPVSGGVKGAVAGTLTVMCGGSEENMQRAMPILEAFGKKIVRCGDTGAGDAVKAMNQALLAIHIWSGGEALAALARLGVDAKVALDVINGSSGRSNSSENLFPERVLGRKYPRTFKLALLDKDVDIAKQIVDEERLDSPFIELASQLFREAREELGEEADHVEAVRIIEKRANVQIS